MKKIQLLNRLGAVNLSTVSLCCAMVTSLALVACGGGSSPAIEPEAVVATVATAQVLEGDRQASLLEFVVTLDKPAVQKVLVTYSTSFTDKPTGYAKGGDSCSSGIDFISVANGSLTINQGEKTGKITVTVCADVLFEPNESLKITWSSAGASGGTVEGVIINDDAGGLNGTGATAVLAGFTAFGRDTHRLTNKSEDGALGFAFDKTSVTSCMIDKVTGLTWQRASTLMQTSIQAQSSVAIANGGIGLCEKTDWRIPTVNEILSLMDFSLTGVTSINADGFDAMSGDYWTSEKTPNNVWTVAANSGALAFVANSASKNLRLVSGGEYANGSSRATACNDSSRYQSFATVVSGVTTVTVEDKKTGLMWKQCSEGATGNACKDTLATQYYVAGNALTRLVDVNKANAILGAGYADWRLPTVKELASLVDRCTTDNVAINGSFFPATNQGSYVSATLDAANGSMPWFVSFSGGEIGALTDSQWSSGLYLRLVRAGQ